MRRVLLILLLLATLAAAGAAALFFLRDSSELAGDTSERLYGLNLTAYTAEGYGQEQVRQDMADLSEMGGNAVALVPTWYMEKGDSSEILPDPLKTPSDASLEQAIEWAGAEDLAVVLKPHVDVLDGTFRGDIQPADRAAWFQSYVDFILYYAAIGERAGADLFVVGTELKSLSADTGAWRQVIAGVRDRFGGELTYAANWDEFSQVQFWDDLDLIGIDAYFPLSEEGETPTAESLAAAWEPQVTSLGQLSEEWGRPVLLTEIGYPTQPGGTAHPWEVRPGEPADPAAQKLAYEAAFAAFDDADWVRGMLWWSWRADLADSERPEIDYTPEGKPAEAVLSDRFR